MGIRELNVKELSRQQISSGLGVQEVLGNLGRTKTLRKILSLGQGTEREFFFGD